MQRNELTSTMLMCTALILAALVLVRGAHLMENKAHAEMAVTKDPVTMVTAPTDADSELLYVLDNRAGVLLVYVHNPNTSTIELLHGLNLRQAFGAANAPGNNTRPRSR